MGLFDGTPLERPVTCELCEKTLDDCDCPRDANGQILLPKDQRVRVGREKRSKGKVVTVVSGLDSSATDLKALLVKLKSACASGGNVADGKLELQGDHRDRVLKMLVGMGYPAKQSGG